jgi:hypothetical protein
MTLQALYDQLLELRLSTFRDARVSSRPIPNTMT